MARVTLETLDVRLSGFEKRMTEFVTSFNQLDGKFDDVIALGVARRLDDLEDFRKTMQDKAIISKVEGHEKFKWAIIVAGITLLSGVLLSLFTKGF